MKFTLTLIFTIVTFASFGQLPNEFLKQGIEKQKQQNYLGAIDDFTKAIAIDSTFSDAYYNRGTAKMIMSDFPNALIDFNKAIKLDPKQITAYYYRGGILVQEQKYNEALQDLNTAIELDEKFPNALTLRGQIKSLLNDTEGSCKDFYRAKEIGDQTAETYISTYCNKKSINSELLSLKWPENEKWELQTPQENDVMKLTELYRNGETFNNWTELGTMTIYKGVTSQDVETRAKLLYDQMLKNCPEAKFTIIEMDKKAEYPWIIFSQECPAATENQSIESQIGYMVQGKSSLYYTNRAVREKSVPADLKIKWTEFFKIAKVINN